MHSCDHRRDQNETHQWIFDTGYSQVLYTLGTRVVVGLQLMLLELVTTTIPYSIIVVAASTGTCLGT